MVDFNLQSRLDNLQTWNKRLAFGGACCERLVPVFSAYCSYIGANDSVLLRARELIWRLVLQSSNDDDIEQEVAMLDEQSPDPETSKFMLANSAANAVFAVQECLRYYSTHELAHIVHVSELSVDIIQEYITKVGFPYSLQFEATDWLYPWISSHPLMTEERNRQIQDLEILGTHQVLDGGVVRQIRKASAQCGIQPLRRGLFARPAGSR